MRRLLALGIVLVVVLCVAVALVASRSGRRPPGEIAFLSYDRGSTVDPHGGVVRVWKDGRVRTIYEAPPYRIVEGGTHWLAGGRVVFVLGDECYSCPAPEAVIVDARGEEHAFSVATTRGARLASVMRLTSQAPSPDQRWVVFAAGRELRVAPTDGGAARTLATCPQRCADPAWH